MAVAPPAPRLPPLSRLHAVALTVEHRGYAAAAAALGVTPGAVRARVRAVEAALGVALVEARPQGLDPTQAGQALGAGLARGFGALTRALAPLGAPPLPLNALVPLEAALRLGGFAAAAAELGVTPSALAERIATVEHWAGRPLFARHARGVAALPVARVLQPPLAEALDTIARAVRGTHRDPVRIAALPAVAQLWLSPRLPALRAALKGIALSVTAMEHPPAAKRAPYDLALFPAASGGTVLARDALIPVCTPALAARIATPRDLLGLPCLGDAVWAGDWARWARANGIDPPRAVLHSLYALAVDEALAGAGVLIGRRTLVQRHLDSGALVAPLGPPLPLPMALRLVPLRPLHGDAARVAVWLRDLAP